MTTVMTGHIFPGNSGKAPLRPVMQVHDIRIIGKGNDKSVMAEQI